MRYVLTKLPYQSRDLEKVGKLDSLIVGRASADLSVARRWKTRPLSDLTTRKIIKIGAASAGETKLSLLNFRENKV